MTDFLFKNQKEKISVAFVTAMLALPEVSMVIVVSAVIECNEMFPAASIRMLFGNC